MEMESLPFYSYGPWYGDSKEFYLMKDFLRLHNEGFPHHESVMDVWAFKEKFWYLNVKLDYSLEVMSLL